jgi:hypothetical protein
MNGLPIYFILFCASELMEDAERAVRNDAVLAASWNDQAYGMLKIIVNYRDSGGFLSGEESASLKKNLDYNETLENLISKKEREAA